MKKDCSHHSPYFIYHSTKTLRIFPDFLYCTHIQSIRKCCSFYSKNIFKICPLPAPYPLLDPVAFFCLSPEKPPMFSPVGPFSGKTECETSQIPTFLPLAAKPSPPCVTSQCSPLILPIPVSSEDTASRVKLTKLYFPGHLSLPNKTYFCIFTVWIPFVRGRILSELTQCLIPGCSVFVHCY